MMLSKIYAQIFFLMIIRAYLIGTSFANKEVLVLSVNKFITME